MIRLVLGGFPCQSFSISQKKNRITNVDFTAEEFVNFYKSDKNWYNNISNFEEEIGTKLNINNYKFALGLQLFFNLIVAIDKIKEQYPEDRVYYLFENVASMQTQVKEVLSNILYLLYGGVVTEINSALVSAQNRKRIYFTNFGNIPQPEDRNILLQDIVESGIVDREKSYALKHQAGNARDYIKKHHTAVSFEPVRIGDIDTTAQAHRVYSSYGKSTSLKANAGGQGGKTGLYMIPVINVDINSNTVIRQLFGGNLEIDGRIIYNIKDGKIPFKGDLYPINLPDGYYIIRKLTVEESKKLQTVPPWFVFPVSDTQAYKMLGNGWTCDVISHILSFIPDIYEEDIEVLSLYDGMSCGKISLINLGLKDHIKKYKAYEIDKYAIETTQFNFPENIQCGDAFRIREKNWNF